MYVATHSNQALPRVGDIAEQHETMIAVDLTEFFARPLRTGIQRVSGELCRHWPADSKLVPVMFHEGKLIRMPECARETIVRFFARGGPDPGTTSESIRAMAQAALGQGSAVDLREGRVLVPEVFYDADRAAFYRSLSPVELENVYFLVFDLLPLTHPEFFDPYVPAEATDRYFRVIRGARNVAFISEATRTAYYERLLRRPVGDGPVLRLGSDSLGERNAARAGRGVPPPHFAALGTIEPRKRHSLILDAFEPLLREQADVRLTFIGRAGWAAGDVIERIRRLGQELPSQFRWMEEADDRTIVEVLSSCRATVFVSAAEGFGLPAVESLWLGVPVVATPGIPSLEQASSVCWTHCTSDSLAHTIRTVCADSYYGSVQSQICDGILPQWKFLTVQTVRWMSAPNISAQRL